MHLIVKFIRSNSNWIYPIERSSSKRLFDRFPEPPPQSRSNTSVFVPCSFSKMKTPVNKLPFLDSIRFRTMCTQEFAYLLRKSNSICFGATNEPAFPSPPRRSALGCQHFFSVTCALPPSVSAKFASRPSRGCRADVKTPRSA